VARANPRGGRANPSAERPNAGADLATGGASRANEAGDCAARRAPCLRASAEFSSPRLSRTTKSLFYKIHRETPGICAWVWNCRPLIPLTGAETADITATYDAR
jgi:hypothetical protein